MDNINIKYIKSGDYSLGLKNKLITFVENKVILFTHNNDVSTLSVNKCFNLNNRDDFVNLLNLIAYND
jgi:hypothetical protein